VFGLKLAIGLELVLVGVVVVGVAVRFGVAGVAVVKPQW
jgi:hypothetical protein